MDCPINQGVQWIDEVQHEFFLQRCNLQIAGVVLVEGFEVGNELVGSRGQCPSTKPGGPHRFVTASLFKIA